MTAALRADDGAARLRGKSDDGGARLPLSQDDGGGRFPGQRSQAERRHWDAATAAVVDARLGLPPDVSFFSSTEEGIAAALLDRLVGQEGEPRVPIVNMVDARLAGHETDGWRYADLPEDGEVWKRTLAYLNEDARDRHGVGFAEIGPQLQDEILASIQSEEGAWHGLPAGHIWNLWLRYACTAFYAHPWAWDEIGFPGPAYPRGYANLGLDRREHFEARDARPGEKA